MGALALSGLAGWVGASMINESKLLDADSQLHLSQLWLAENCAGCFLIKMKVNRLKRNNPCEQPEHLFVVSEVSLPVFALHNHAVCVEHGTVRTEFSS